VAENVNQIDSVEFYWRPGCGFCMMLERRLDEVGIPLSKHNIWDDPSNAAVVRSHAKGNETVPTLIIDDVALVNPSADEVLAVLNTKAPHLVPETSRPTQPG
jgi:glutaredoxin